MNIDDSGLFVKMGQSSTTRWTLNSSRCKFLLDLDVLEPLSAMVQIFARFA